MKWLFRRRYSEFSDEVASHIALETDRLIAEGLSPKEARAAAIRKFGNPTSAREAFYESRRLLLFDSVWRNLRYAFRRLAGTPAFALTAILILALGIGVVSSVFSIAEPLLARRLPVRAPDELVLLRTANPAMSDGRDRVPDELFLRLAEGSSTLSGVLATRASRSMASGPYDSWSYDLSVEGEGAGDDSAPISVDYEAVTGSYFPVLGVQAVAGRLIAGSDDRAGAPPVVVISYRLWQRRFAGSEEAIGAVVRLHHPLGGYYGGLTIVGVAAPGFYGTDIDVDTDVWLPFEIFRNRFTSPTFMGGRTGVRVMARAGEGASLEEIQAEAVVLSSQLTAPTRAVDETGRVHIRVDPGARGYSDLRLEFSEPVVALSLAAALVLLIVWANLAGLMFMRGASREREMAVRLAIGGGRGSLVGQLIAEGLILALGGGLLGLLLAEQGGHFVTLFLPADAGFVVRGAQGARTLVFTSVTSLLGVMLFGLVPGLKVSGKAITSSLSREGRSIRRTTVLRLIVIGQVAVSLFLIVAAGLFLRTLRNLRSVDVGIDTRSIIEFQVEADRLGDFPGLGLERIEALPGVVSATVYDQAGMLGGEQDELLVSASSSGEEVPATEVRMGRGFFETMDISFVSGADFPPDTWRQSPLGNVFNGVILSESLAERLFGNENPLGRALFIGDWSERPGGEDDDPIGPIVGVVQDVKHDGLREASSLTLYWPIVLIPRFAVRTEGDGSRLMPAIRKVVEDFDPEFRIAHMHTLRDARDASIAPERFVAQLAGVFGLVSLILAAIGIFGVFSYAASCRKSEIGIRMALGAQRRTVIGMLMRETVWVVGTGVVLGLLAALATTRFVASLLFGVSPMDPASVVAATLILVAASMMAAWLPARRAARQDPMVALRHE